MKKLLKKILDFKKIKEDNIILTKRVKELEEKRQPLIDLKNKYLSDLRCKNLENGRLKKQIEELNENKQLKEDKRKAIEYIKLSIENGDYLEDDIQTDISPATFDKYVNSKELLEILGDKENE